MVVRGEGIGYTVIINRQERMNRYAEKIYSKEL
jgi:hypothetical protein